jgi:hypothetical protein
LKFVHFARDNFYKQQEIYDAATSLLKLSEIKFPEKISKKELLMQFRKWENRFLK